MDLPTLECLFLVLFFAFPDELKIRMRGIKSCCQSWRRWQNSWLFGFLLRTRCVCIITFWVWILVLIKPWHFHLLSLSIRSYVVIRRWIILITIYRGWTKLTCTILPHSPIQSSTQQDYCKSDSCLHMYQYNHAHNLIMANNCSYAFHQSVYTMTTGHSLYYHSWIQTLLELISTSLSVTVHSSWMKQRKEPTPSSPKDITHLIPI